VAVVLVCDGASARWVERAAARAREAGAEWNSRTVVPAM
jgi:hypothetical protein